MHDKKDLITSPELWGGLHCPGRSLDNTDIAVFGIPYDGGVSFRAGAREGPDALRAITFTMPPTSETFEDLSALRLCDRGNIFSADRDQMFWVAEETVTELVHRKIFFTMLGGDHSTSIPVMKGFVNASHGPVGIIHLDAHFDLCKQMKGDSYSHGCTEQRALELKGIEGLHHIFFIGVRSMESQELPFLRDPGLTMLSARNCTSLGMKRVIEQVRKKMAPFPTLYLTLDIDVLDPAFAPGTGTPQAGGLSTRELLTLLEGLFELPIAGMDLVEIAPSLDPSGITLFTARKILTECWTHHYRKMKR
jgi:agmatinase